MKAFSKGTYIKTEAQENLAIKRDAEKPGSRASFPTPSAPPAPNSALSGKTRKSKIKKNACILYITCLPYRFQKPYTV